jgi:hypothetical protein
VPRIVIVPSPVLDLADVRVVGEALDSHLDVIIAIDDEWRDLILAYDDADLMLRLKMCVLDAVSGCKTGVGNICPAVVLRQDDIRLLWLADDGSTGLLSVKETARRRELLYAPGAEPTEGVKLFRLQTHKPMEPGHGLFFDRQFENLELEFYESLYNSKRDVERWRKLAGASTLPAIAGAVAGAARRFVMELCIFGEYNVCPGMLLLEHGGRVDVKILKISAKAENYLSRIDLAGLLANRQPPVQPAP